MAGSVTGCRASWCTLLFLDQGYRLEVGHYRTYLRAKDRWHLFDDEAVYEFKRRYGYGDSAEGMLNDWESVYLALYARD